MVDKAAKKRVQGGIDRSRAEARRLLKQAARTKDPVERLGLLKEAELYDREVKNLIKTNQDLGVK